ncbi:helix-turn-helix domain-containing protein [Nonomuraea thailandensis]
MEQVAEAAGVARATVHRRFASREALIEAMEVTAWREILQAVHAARPQTAPRWSRCTRPPPASCRSSPPGASRWPGRCRSAPRRRPCRRR